MAHQTPTLPTVRLTMAQALVRFLDAQYLADEPTDAAAAGTGDGAGAPATGRHKFVHGVFAVFGHGNVVGLGEALVEMPHRLAVYQGHNEQGMAHAATAFAKQHNRRRICVATSSIGPGALNMVTAAATATVNRIPLLLLPGDAFASRRPDPVLQQIEHAHDPTITANDAFRSVSVYWDRITRPEQLMSSALQALRVLTDPAQTGAVTLCLPQDVQAQAYDYPTRFFEPRTWVIERRPPAPARLRSVAEAIAAAKRPLVIVGGGVRYSLAAEALQQFCEQTQIVFAETQAGKGTIAWDHPLNLGGIGVTGGLAANRIAADADLVIAVGTRLSDFTTASKSAFANPDVAFVTINVNSFDAAKMAAEPLVCDAKLGLEALCAALAGRRRRVDYGSALPAVQAQWRAEVDRLYAGSGDQGPTGAAGSTENALSQTRVLGLLNEELLPPQTIVVGSSGSLPGDMQRLWRSRRRDGYHMEYGFSCMGYEIAGAFGVKLAAPDRPVVAMVGDGSYIMLHSELVTAVREGIALVVVVFDNSGYQCIDNLQTSKGIASYATYFRSRDAKGRLNGPTAAFDFAANAAAYGAAVWRVTTEAELRAAVPAALQAGRPAVIDVKVAAKSMTDGYESWWEVGVPEVSTNSEVARAGAEMRNAIKRARPY